MDNMTEDTTEDTELVKWLLQMREQSLQLRDDAEEGSLREHFQGRINAFQAVLEYVDGREFPHEDWTSEEPDDDDDDPPLEPGTAHS